MTDDELQFLRRLQELGVRFTVIGGHAVFAHGHPRNTEDLDLVWLRTPETEQKLLDALQSIQAKWISNEIDPATRLERLVPVSDGYIRAHHLMMLVTDIGFVDLFDYVPGCDGADVEQILTESIDAEGIRVVSLPWLRRMKKAAGRTKDRIDLDELDKLNQ